MAKLTLWQKVMHPLPRKRFGYSQYFGASFFAYTRFGEENPSSGIYQKRNSFRQNYHINTLMYWPKNPRSSPQQAWRAIFADGAVAWSLLTSDQKKVYNKRALPKHMAGYHLFQREYLQSH